MPVKVGNCSWAEKTLIQSREFYPSGVSTAEERLRYYSENFDVVEVDSSYYAIPSVKTVNLWAERTPPDFIFHMKAYGPLTGHSADLGSMPVELRDMVPTESLKEKRIYLKDREVLNSAFTIFKTALMPLKTVNKLGVIVFQYPPYFTFKKENLDYILFCKEKMGDIQVGIEFRHGSWLEEKMRREVFHFLQKNDLIYITADEPQYGTMTTVPFVPEAVSDTAYLRFHGRNRKNWLKRGIETSERYNYLYSEEELRSFIPAIREMNKKAKTVHAMFNNCHMGFSIRNSREMKKMLRDEGMS
jgi:uncharacterized protein YecE (DUF72 family)